jgi:hypothetical protein
MNVGGTRSQSSTHVSSGDAAPYFADGVLAKARANKQKLAAYNQAHRDEPVALAKAIRKHYADNPLVNLLKESLGELSQERGKQHVFVFGAPTFMVLSQYGFGTCVQTAWGKPELQARSLGDTVPVGERGTCAGVRVKIDQMITTFAEDPERYVRSDIEQVEYQLKPTPKPEPKPVPEAAERAPAEPVPMQQATSRKRRGFIKRIFHRH